MVTKGKIFAFVAAALVFTAVVLPKQVMAMTVDVKIPQKYTEVQAGESVYFETDIKWPENNGRKDLRIEYSVRNKDGEEVAYMKVLKAIETQASFMDQIPIPESLTAGKYKIIAKINDYKNLNEEVAASFSVIKSIYTIQTLLIIIVGLLGVVTAGMTIEMYILLKRHN